nr:Chain D, Hexokinase-2 [Saccharomyces cerevisiae]
GGSYDVPKELMQQIENFEKIFTV